MSKVIGKNGISAEVVQHSVSPTGKEIITFNVKYGLIVHAEFLRHRMLSRGVKSNRAIPMPKIRSEVINDPYVPVWFGAAQKGMVADKEVDNKWLAKQVWLKARYLACGAHWVAEKLGAHKEWANRLLNPWQWVRETITATEWDNFYNLRIHPDAQKDIQEIAKCVHKAHKQSTPLAIDVGDWHVPYVTREVVGGVILYKDNDGKNLTPEQAVHASAARCARSSYDNHDGTSSTYEVDKTLYNMLIESDPKHASPVEHEATPIQGFNKSNRPMDWSRGVTHRDRQLRLWSGNFHDWIQYRQTLDNHTCENYTP